MEDGFGRGERGEKRVGGGSRSEADVKPSNFLDGVAVDIGAESAGDELGSEADAEERLAGGDGLGDELTFEIEER